MILTLGGYDGETLAASLRDSVSNVLLKWYAEDVDPGVHGAVAWLFGNWGKAADLVKIDESQAGRPRGKRRWFVTEEGQTMTGYHRTDVRHRRPRGHARRSREVLQLAQRTGPLAQGRVDVSVRRG